MIAKVTKIVCTCDVCKDTTEYNPADLVTREGWDITSTSEIKLKSDPDTIVFRRIGQDASVCSKAACIKKIVDELTAAYRKTLEVVEPEKIEPTDSGSGLLIKGRQHIKGSKATNW